MFIVVLLFFFYYLSKLPYDALHSVRVPHISARNIIMMCDNNIIIYCFIYQTGRILPWIGRRDGPAVNNGRFFHPPLVHKHFSNVDNDRERIRACIIIIISSTERLE